MNTNNMKTMSKKFFSRLALLVFVGLTAVACSQVEDTEVLSVEAPQISEDSMYHYQMQLDCAMPSFDTNGQTRAVSYTKWEDNQVLNIRFKNGSSWIVGQATYSKAENIWNVGTYATLPTTVGEETCEVYYFYQARGSSSTQITMNEQTACYMTKTGTYSHPTANSISMTAVLDKMTWRLRFKGTAGTSITLPSSDNDINFFSALSLTTGNFTSGKKDVSLTVASDGYTPYVYGAFSSTSGGKITVTSDQSYYRTLTSSNLAVGESGCLTIPTASSYSGWTPIPDDHDEIDPNATIAPNDMVVFTDGIVTDWKLGSTANTFDYAIFTKSGAEKYTDGELVELVYTSPYSMDKASNIFGNWNSEWYEPDTEYYLCAVAKNSAGTRGPVLRQMFKTKSESLPYAEISNIKASTTTKWSWNVSLKNNAKSYYMATSTDEDDYNSDWHWFGYFVHYWGVSGQIEARDWAAVSRTLSSGTCNVITVCTWGLDANNNIGNCNVAFGSASSSARTMNRASSAPAKQVLSKEKILRLRDNIVVYRIDESY